MISQFLKITVNRQDHSAELSDIRLQLSSSELRRLYEVSMICRQGYCSEANGDTSEDSEVCPVV
jgi:hypothetical protein